MADKREPPSSDSAAGLQPERVEQAQGRALPKGATFLPRGAAIGRYVILEPLGAGGMGVVYLAYDPELDRRVALKLLRSDKVPERLQAGLQARLLREARAMARLTHAEVIGVHDVGQMGQLVFIAMEYVEGSTLRQWLAQRPRSSGEILEIFVKAGRGLSAAHAAGLIHRDFKPDNVLVGKDGRVRVSDFGLARAVTDPAVPATIPVAATPLPLGSATSTDVLVGSPVYMASELLEGHEASPLSDLFGFCVSLYEALTGERPFSGKSVGELKQSISAGPPRDGAARLPQHLRRVLLRGLSLRPEDRWQSMDALLAELLRDPAQTWRRAALAGALVLLGGTALFGYRHLIAQRTALCNGAEARLAGTWDAQRRASVEEAFARSKQPFAKDTLRAAEAALDLFTSRWSSARRDACEATRLRGEQSEELLDLRMQCFDQVLVQTRAVVDLLDKADAKVVQRAAQIAQGAGSLAPCQNAQLLRGQDRAPVEPAATEKLQQLRAVIAAARAEFSAGRYQVALDRSLPALEAARTLGYRPLIAESLLLVGRLQDYLSDTHAAEVSLHEAALYGEISARPDVAARALGQLIYVVGYTQGRVDEGLRWGRVLEQLIARLGGDRDLEVLREQQIGSVLSLAGKDDEALVHLRLALALREKELGPDDPDISHSVEALAVGLTRARRYQEAMPLYLRALDLAERRLGPHHPDVARLVNNMGGPLFEMGRYEEVHALTLRAVTIWEATLPPDHPDLAMAIRNLAGVENELGRPAEALAQARRSIAMSEKSEGPDSSSVGLGLLSVGRSLELLGKPQAAVAPLERALRILTPGQGDPSDRTEAMFRLGCALWDSGGDKARARSLVEASRAAAAELKSPRLQPEIDAWAGRELALR